MDPQGVRGKGVGVHEDQKNKALYSFTSLLQELRGPPVVCKNTLGVHGNYFDFLGSTEQKRLKTTALFSKQYFSFYKINGTPRQFRIRVFRCSKMVVSNF
jgi:hypothetical protein